MVRLTTKVPVVGVVPGMAPVPVTCGIGLKVPVTGSRYPGIPAVEGRFRFWVSAGIESPSTQSPTRIQFVYFTIFSSQAGFELCPNRYSVRSRIRADKLFLATLLCHSQFLSLLTHNSFI